MTRGSVDPLSTKKGRITIEKLTKVLAVIIAVIGTIALNVGALILVAWGINVGVAFVTGYEIGLWRTFVAMLLIIFVLRFAATQLRTN